MSKDRSKRMLSNEHRVFFGAEIQNPVGYIRSGGENIRHDCNIYPNIHSPDDKPYYVLSMLLEAGTATYRDENGFTCHLSFGDFVIRFPHFEQSYTAGIGDRYAELNIGFTGALFDLYREWGVLSPARAVWHLVDPVPWISRMRDILQMPRPTTSYAVACETASFAAFLMKLLGNAVPKNAEQPATDWFVRACIMLTNDLSKKVNLRDIAEEIGMGYDSFRLRFAERAGISPMRYRNDKRMEVACNLLKDTNKSTAEIAFYLGFNDDRHLSAFLKRRTGFSPQKYRQQQMPARDE